MNWKKLLISIVVLFIVTPIIYSIVWLVFSSKIISHFGGNSFCRPAFPKVGQYIYVDFPSSFNTGYILNADMIPVLNDSLKLTWWEESKIEQWLPSYETGYTVNVTEHHMAPLQNDKKYSYKEMTREAPAYFHCKIANNNSLVGKSVEFNIQTDTTILAKYNLRILQPQSEGYKKYRTLQNMFRFSLKMIIVLILSTLLLYWYGNRYLILFGTGLFISIALIITTPGKAKFESYVKRLNRTSGKLTQHELVEIDNYILLSVGKIEIKRFIEDEYPLVFSTQDITISVSLE